MRIVFIKIGIITDVYNNVITLNPIIKLFEEKECDEIFCCGDIIVIGTFPEETVQKINSLTNLKCVLGNHDKCLINGIKKPYPKGMDYLMVHLKTSEELLKRCEFIKDKGAFYMGSIAPDAIMFRKGCKREDKALTHFCTGNEKWGHYTNYEEWKDNLYCNIKK